MLSPVPTCFLPLGVEDRRIPNKGLTASSSSGKAQAPSNGRLHFQRRLNKAAGWKPENQDASPWFQVDLQSIQTVAGIGTQGGRSLWWKKGGWVGKYNVSFSKDGAAWQTYNESGHVKVHYWNALNIFYPWLKSSQNHTFFFSFSFPFQEFLGNNDTNTVVINRFSSPLRARFIRIYPSKLKSRGFLRLELYGCQGTFTSWIFPSLLGKTLTLSLPSS